MQKDPYLVLGLTKGATKEQVEDAYKELKDKYSKDYFLEGEIGMEASRKLSELESAYKDCLEDIKNTESEGRIAEAYNNIENTIRAGKYDDAQNILDEIDTRNAEWHYYQAMIYFKKGWHSESKSQLEICIVLEPNNEKYTKALEKMKDYFKNQGTFNNNTNNNNAPATQQQSNNNQADQRAGYQDRQANANANANACCDSCCTLMCCDSCCECMGGDLIPCC